MTVALPPLAYSALERIPLSRPGDRLGLIESHASGKRVFDLGALDETAFEAKQSNGRWLHDRLCRVALEVVGIDNSTKVPAEGLVTAKNGRIVRADIFSLGSAVSAYGKPDLVVVGELIEHLPDTLGFLQSLKRCTDLTGAELVFSTPNACSWHNLLIGLTGRESMHQDHLQIYSYKTLRTLFNRAGIDLLTLHPYHVRFDEMIEQTHGVTRLSVKAFQAMVNGLEKLSPILSGGWVGVARL
jgi:hypothetical protein